MTWGGNARTAGALAIACLLSTVSGATTGQPVDFDVVVTEVTGVGRFNIGMPPTNTFTGACGRLGFKGSDEELQVLRGVEAGARGRLRMQDADARRLGETNEWLGFDVQVRFSSRGPNVYGLEVSREGFKSARECGR